MAFHVYPDVPANPQNNPLNVIAGGTGFIAFSEPPGLSNFDTIFIRVAMSDPTLPISTGAAPTISLRAGTGDVTQINVGTADVLIYDTPGENPADLVGGANISDNGAPNDVFLIELTVFTVGSIWELHIENNDVSPRDFVCVVADLVAETEQPWIHVVDNLDFDSLGQHLTGQGSVQLNVAVFNKGTGSLNVNAGDVGPIGASPFEVLSVPGSLAPNSVGNLTIGFDAPLTPGQSAVNYDITSNDTTAKSGVAGISHNRRVAIDATTGKLELMVLLDASGSMAYQPNGDPNVVADTDSRWGKMTVAAEEFLDLLSDFAGGLGRFGIATFPDITNVATVCPVPSPSAATIQRATDIADPAIATAISALTAPTLKPKQTCAATPLGFGIGHMIGTTPASHGFFNGDANSVAFNLRWLVLMSDGKHNSGPPDPQEFYKTGEGGGSCPDVGTAPNDESFVDKNIRVISVAYGDDDVATPFEVDHALLERLACKSNGVALDAGADDAGMALLKEFRAAITDGLALDPTEDPVGWLTGDKPEARHQISVTEYDKKVSFVVNWATHGRDVDVQLVTPDCQVITPSVAQEHPHMRYHDHPRYTIYTIEEGYLRGEEGGISRHGVWELLISSEGLYSEQSEQYEYEVITDSRLKLSLELDRGRYYAGDPIHLTARLTLNGQPVPDATVYLNLTKPGQAVSNILARAKVTAEEFAQAAESLRGEVDATQLGIKRHALGLTQRGVTPITKFSPIDMPFAAGAYTATITNTQVPEKYTFYVTATGRTENGTFYRREKRIQVRVTVRPLPDFSIFDVLYGQFIEDEQIVRFADVRIIPQDQFGNAFLVEPDLDPTIFGMAVTGGRFAGPLVSNLDGSYTRRVIFETETSPVISVDIAGEVFTTKVKIIPTGQLTYVDRVIDFKLGAEAKQGANQHRDPRAALGDVTRNDRFVALGGLGSIVLGFEDQSLVIRAQGDDDVTVFVQPGDPRRLYSVEAQPVNGDRWIELGRADVTAHFGLGKAGLTRARAVRIIDRSFQLMDSSGEASPAPGAGVHGVGVRSVGAAQHWLADASIEHLDTIKEDEVKLLKRSGISTISDMSSCDLVGVHCDIPKWRLLELRSRAIVALDAADEVPLIKKLADWSLWRVSESTIDSLLEASGAPKHVVIRLCEQVAALRLALKRAFMEKITVGQMARRKR